MNEERDPEPEVQKFRSATNTIDAALKQALQGKEVVRVDSAIRLARLHKKKLFNCTHGSGKLKGYQYLLGRLVLSLFNDVRTPFLDAECRWWELWLYPDGRLTIRFERKLEGLQKPLNLEHELRR